MTNFQLNELAVHTTDILVQEDKTLVATITIHFISYLKSFSRSAKTF